MPGRRHRTSRGVKEYRNVGSRAPGASVRVLRTLPYAPCGGEHSC
ncbi:hypothetical protein DB32_004318 [Sandaracinus amylolyticus]|uniref:Uncharacterized protein n=1 Tax=Sandaracinus amylolyticus TaxID=927083 RepID=A0A0F6SFL8_9BACT|nr:hypothetical protein DB32_004318 [Sandaracinus amylolyticus]